MSKTGLSSSFYVSSYFGFGIRILPIAWRVTGQPKDLLSYVVADSSVSIGKFTKVNLLYSDLLKFWTNLCLDFTIQGLQYRWEVYQFLFEVWLIINPLYDWYDFN